MKGLHDEGPAPLVLNGTGRASRPVMGNPITPTTAKKVPPPQSAFKVRVDRQTAARLKDFSEEFRGVSAAHVIALAAENCMENADGLDYRYQLARQVKAAAKEDRFGMYRNREEMKKYLEQLTHWCAEGALDRLQRWAAKWDVCVGALVREILADVFRTDTDCEGCYLDQKARKAKADCNPENYPQEEGAK